jgi:hypothetical protein
MIKSLPAPLIASILDPRSVDKLSFSSEERFPISILMSGEIQYWRIKDTGTSRAVLARDWQPFPLPGCLYRDPTSDTFLVDTSRLLEVPVADPGWAARRFSQSKDAPLEGVSDHSSVAPPHPYHIRRAGPVAVGHTDGSCYV